MPDQIDIPHDLPRWQAPDRAAENLALADKFATPGTVEHFVLRLGFMPNNEAGAEGIIVRLLQERDWLEEELARI